MTEKRAHFRMSLQAEASMADVLGNTWCNVNMLDVSRAGAAMIVPGDLHVGASRMFRFQLPGIEKKIAVVARIANCTKHPFLVGYRVGIEFVRIDTEDAMLIADFIANAAQVQG